MGNASYRCRAPLPEPAGTSGPAVTGMWSTTITTMISSLKKANIGSTSDIFIDRQLQASLALGNIVLELASAYPSPLRLLLGSIRAQGLLEALLYHSVCAFFGRACRTNLWSQFVLSGTSAEGKIFPQMPHWKREGRKTHWEGEWKGSVHCTRRGDNNSEPLLCLFLFHPPNKGGGSI